VERANAGRLVDACWTLGGAQGWDGLRRWAHMLGFSGTFFGAVRQRSRAGGQASRRMSSSTARSTAGSVVGSWSLDASAERGSFDTEPFSSCTTVRFDVLQDKAGVHDCAG